MEINLREIIIKNGGILHLKVIPKSSRNQIVGMLGERHIKVKLQAVAENGKANSALIEIFADALDISQSQISILSGEHSQKKVVKIHF